VKNGPLVRQKTYREEIMLFITNYLFCLFCHCCFCVCCLLIGNCLVSCFLLILKGSGGASENGEKVLDSRMQMRFIACACPTPLH
jgi:hypothetical protein